MLSADAGHIDAGTGHVDAGTGHVDAGTGQKNRRPIWTTSTIARSRRVAKD